MKAKVALHNLGCKVNAYETEAMHQLLENEGYEIVEFAPGADVYIINTCTVTNIADRKSRQMLHKAKKMNPNAVVVAAGCYAQSGEEQLKKDDAIDIIIGNNRKKDLLTILEEHVKNTEKSHNIDINHTNEYEEMSVSKMTEHTRAYIKVQDGCNQFCSYCIIPYARGRVRSRKKEDVLSEVRRLASAGCREIVLTGIHLSSYGIDLENESLLGLIREIHAIDGIERIRLGSLEPRIITDEFASSLAALGKVCPHFHLSLQSGCDETLQRMNRRYSAAEYREKCELLRKYFTAPALTTDVIVGFPGETEEEFEKSYQFVDDISFYETHVFKYSRREGTKAAAMKEQIPEQEKAVRSEKLIRLAGEKKRRYMESFIGKDMEVLLEEPMTAEDGNKYWTGYTPEYIKVAVDIMEGQSNALLTVKGERILSDGMIFAMKTS